MSKQVFAKEESGVGLKSTKGGKTDPSPLRYFQIHDSFLAAWQYFQKQKTMDKKVKSAVLKQKVYSKKNFFKNQL